MKTIKYIIGIIICLLLVSSNVYAVETSKNTTLEYLGDGIYLETIIEEDTTMNLEYSTASTIKTKTGTKTWNYTNSSKETIFSLKLKGTFTYTGSSSKYTDVSFKATINGSTWKLISSSKSKSGNKATGKATLKQYFDGTVVQTLNPTITLKCSSTGVLS